MSCVEAARLVAAGRPVREQATDTSRNERSVGLRRKYSERHGRRAGMPLTRSQLTVTPCARPSRRRGGPWAWETVLVLGVSLGASAVWAVLSIIEKLTRTVPLSQQTTAMNQSATPGRPWLDLAYQLAGIVAAARRRWPWRSTC